MLKDTVLSEKPPKTMQDASGTDQLIWGLHDGVAQPLWYLTMELKSLLQQPPANLKDVLERVKVLEGVAQEGYKQVRVVLKQARCRTKPLICLQRLVTETVNAFRETTGADVRLRVPAVEIPLRQEVAYHLVAILQEALWNSWKHAKGCGLRVGLAVRDNSGTLTVADNGPGFDQSVSREGHYGLVTMRERAEAIGGSLKIDSVPGQGTRVMVNFIKESSLQCAGRVERGRTD